MEIVICIPAYKPDQKLIRLIDDLRSLGFSKIVVTDDGGGQEYAPVFMCAEKRGCVVAHHDYNLGKGAALRTGMEKAVRQFGEEIGVITADADGQHLPHDIAKIAEAMNSHPDRLVLGTRDFSGKTVPVKSALGNRITSAFFKVLTGVTCRDTQTGLRGIPSSLLPLALSTEGDRYDYEMNFLIKAVKKAPLLMISIETVYEGGNKGSHFRPVRDSFLIYKSAFFTPGSPDRLRRRWRIVSTAVITIWAAWALLDAFVIPNDIVAAPQITGSTSFEAQAADGSDPQDIPDPLVTDPLAADPLDGSLPDDEVFDEEGEPLVIPAEPVITENSYNDGMISIGISTMRLLDTDVYIADVSLLDPSSIRTALAGGVFARNVTEPTSEIAERSGAIFAVNGDYYGFRATGYVMRNGYLYRSSFRDEDQEDLVLYEDGSLEIVKETDVTAEELRDAGATDIFSFGPGLVIDGEISVDENDEVKRAQVTNPRTAIGLLSPLHYLFVVSDGRTEESIGLSLYDLAKLMKDLGCITAYNLDGGGSSTMWFNGKVLNNPTTYGKAIQERSVSDIVYIGK